MAWRRYPFESVWRDMDDMRSVLDSLFHQTNSGSRLLMPGGVADRMLPALRGEFRVDVREHDNDVIIVADLPGVEKKGITIQLINPRFLEIAYERNDEKEETTEGYYMRERIAGSMARVVTLPADVTEEDSSASFKNGVLEVRLRKVKGAAKSRIPIE